jgi:hypothetical protein
MSWFGYNVPFVMVVSFINSSWEPTHVTMGIFEMHNITNASMANQIKVLFDSFGLLDKVVAYAKAKGSNLFALTITLTIVVSCLRFQLPCPFVKSCFGHVMSKAC